MIKSPLHHLRHPEGLFEYFHEKIHHAFLVFGLAIIGMLWGASNILTPSFANRQWGGFLNSDFWSQNPTNDNIMYSLFGDGTPGNTAYTRLWNSSCVATNIVTLSAGSFNGMTGAANTIYILNPGTYMLTKPILMNGNCSALIGENDVYFKPSNGNIIPIVLTNNKSDIIIDNIKIDGMNIGNTGIYINNAHNITLNNIDIYQFSGNNDSIGIVGTGGSTNILLNNSKLFNNYTGGTFTNSSITINNSLFFNNLGGFGVTDSTSSINNSQFSNNTISLGITSSYFAINNCIIMNNNIGSYAQYSTGVLNNVSLYNNNMGIQMDSVYIDYYGTLKLFNNTNDYSFGIGSGALNAGSASPIGSRSDGVLDTGLVTMDYDRVTNPQNGSGKWLLSGTLTGLRGVISFDPTRNPIRYIFGGNILKQIMPVWYTGIMLEEYGNDGSDYTTTKYIGEPDSSLSGSQQLIVNQYFGPNSTFTQNRGTNGCSLSAFQIVYLNPGNFGSTYNFQDHTIYILTGGEYRSSIGGTGNGFVFNGNCIALIGNQNTRFTKSNMIGMQSMFYANNKRNIIIDTIKVDGLYYDVSYSSIIPTHIGINFAGNSNNTTINMVQAYNNSQYGIYLGLGSHHNTIINTQAFNNTIAGIYFYYSSNYNIINNTQTYNNSGYGIRFANGSRRNTMNNFQTYNNAIGIFGDLTTQENIFNRVAIYNNSDVGMLFKNSSGNVFNDVRIYNNDVGLQMLYSSLDNLYYGELKFFDNHGGDFDGTDADDSYLSAGIAGLFPYAGTLTTGTNVMSCLYATNPTYSGSSFSLLSSTGTCNNTGYNSAFISSSDTYVHYAFGLNMYKQDIPVRYDSGDNLIQIPSQYDTTKYIAEIFAIRDTTPEGVNFMSSGAVELNSWYSTNVYTASVINTSIPITLSFIPDTSSGYLVINGTNAGLTGIVNNGDTLQINVLTQTGYNQTTTGTIMIGTVTTGFTVTTRGYSQTPTSGSITFTNLSSLPFNTFTGSTVIISGIETGVSASISFVPSTTSGRLEIYSGTTLVSSGTTGLLVYNGNQVKAIGQSSSGYQQTITVMVTVGLGTGVFTLTTKGSDATAPTTPSLTYPLSGENLFFITFGWTASTDTGSGLYGYEYQISRDNGFSNIAYSGVVLTGTVGIPDTSFNVIHNQYYLRIRAKDMDGNYSPRSNTGHFNAVNISNRNFNSQDNVNLNSYYDSNDIVLSNIGTGISIWAVMDNSGTLYQNGSDVGTGTYVQNGDVLHMTLKSSNSYDRTVSSTLTIANRTLEFNVTTKQQSDNSCTLSDNDKTTIQTIFDSLVQNYSGDADKFSTFLSTMESMLSDQIDFTNNCNLQYLQDLINSQIGNTTGAIDTGSHIAPNCKEYPVSFDTTRRAYTSPVFKVITYFINRDALGRYIDSKNPGDCHLNTYSSSSWVFVNTDPSRHIAPNGKVYTIQSTTQGYSSNEFSVPKYFASIAELRTYIDIHNAPQAIRSHQVDTSFTPQTYNAPNGKTYTIYKTDRGYMSYMLLNVRYFSSLADIQAFINNNNRH